MSLRPNGPIQRPEIWGAERSDPLPPPADHPEALAFIASGPTGRPPRLRLDGSAEEYAAALSYTDGRSGAWVRSVSDTRHRRVDVRGYLVSDGRVVGSFDREFDREGGVVHHHSLNIAAGAQGAGVGRDFMERSLAAYRTCEALTAVEVSAGGQVGGYAWARHFDFLGPSLSGRIFRMDDPRAEAAVAVWASYGGRERLAVACEDGRCSWDVWSRCEEFFGALRDGRVPTPTPTQIAAFGAADRWVGAGRTMWPGKAILLGSEWRGIRKL